MGEGTKACTPVYQNEFDALAERVRALEAEAATALQQVIDRMTGLVKIVGGVDTRVHAIEMEGLEATQAAVTECLSALESSICSCRDCLMHREKARHTVPPRGVGVTPIPSEEAPAWQRAKVGDRVEVHLGRVPVTATVRRVDEGDACRLLVHEVGGNARHDMWWAINETVISILPPEPAAPVQDVRERVAAALRKACLEEFGSTWSNDVSGGFADVAISTIGLAGAPQPLSIDWNTALDTYYATARAPNGTASDALMTVLKLVPGLEVKA